MSNFSMQQIPLLDGKVIVVTGGNSGLGFESVKALSARGAQVVMASRNEQKAWEASSAIQSDNPEAKVEFIQLDLASLDSVKRFVTEFKQKFDRLDVLMNNAGLMAIPQRTTAEGFEMQFGTNHLGHFALTADLLDVLLATQNSRVVSVTSLAATFGKIQFNDLMWKKNYSRWRAYGQSKLANMLFGLELQRRLAAHNSATVSVLAHPGFSGTNLQAGPADEGGLLGSLIQKSLGLMAQSQAAGALPQLYAATQPDVNGGDYFGPAGFQQIYGEPERVPIPGNGKNRNAAEKLWNKSLELTGVDFSPL